MDCNPGRREAVGRPERRVVSATILTGSQVSQGAVGPLLIVFHAPAFHDDPSFKQGAKELPVKAFIAELVMEAFDVPVFPWGARRDVEGLDALIREPVLDGIGDELWAIVTSDVLGCSVALDSRFHHRDDIHRTDAPCGMGCQTLPGVLVDQRQDPEAAAVLSLIFYEVPAPDVPWPLGLQTLCCGDSYSTGPLLTLADLESLFPPNPSHLLGVDLEAISPKECCDPPITIPGMLQAQLDHLFTDTTTLNALPRRTVVTRAGESKSTACQCRTAPAPFDANFDGPPLG